jgi:peptide/nickel transport system substrate-binding protein
MQDASYWSRLTNSRLNRRRTITGATGIGLSAAALALLGCGGGDGDSGGDSSGLVYKPVSSTKQAKPGGTLKHFDTRDAITFDATGDSSANASSQAAAPFYPRLLRRNFVAYPEEADGSASGEIAQSWEVSPDKLQITLKVRPNMYWDSRAPTNRRAIDAQDIVFAWNKFRSVNANAAALRYDPNDAASGPVESITAPDSGTVVMKLQAPYAEIIPMLGAYDLLYIMPRESDGGFDPRNTVRGHGPFRLQEYLPGASFTWVKNPDFYIQGRPFMDRVDVPIIPEYAARLAQWKAGNIYTDVVSGAQQDVLRTKRDHPEALMTQDDLFPTSATNMIQFGWEQGLPWRDPRVRQAISMTLDREAYIDVIDNRDSYRKEGIEIAVRQNSVVPGGWNDYWLDPTDEKEFGANAKYLRLNIAEAKKLLSAAGVKDGFEFEINIGGHYGDAYNKICEVYSGMIAAAGLKPQIKVIAPATVWLSNYGQIYRFSTGRYKPGDGFSGLAVVPDRNFVTVAVQLFNHWNIGGGSHRGAGVEGRPVQEGDPKLQDLTVKIIREFDRNKQVSLVHELSRYVTERSYYVPRPSSAKLFSLWWPAVGNVGAYRSAPNAGTWVDTRQNWWIDETKAPIKKA